MKKIALQALLTLALLSITIGCESILDVKSQSQITGQDFFANQDDFQAYITGIYTQQRTLLNTITYGIERSDELIQGTTAGLSSAWSQNITAASGGLDYTNVYSIIGNTNLYLSKAEPFSFTNQTLKKRLQAEALCLRAYAYFHLTRIFGDVPILLDPVVNETVPQLPRRPAAEVLAQVFTDLDQAISLFPESGFVSKYRWSRPAANALKAEAKLWNAKVNGGGDKDLTDALTAIAEVEKSGVSLLANFRDITNKLNGEIILSVYFDRNETTNTPMYAQKSLVQFSTSQSATNIADLPTSTNVANASSGVQISPQGRALFDKYPDDKRKNATYIWELKGTTQVYAWLNKYRGTKYAEDRVPDDDLILFRLADILLLKAEALAALNRLPDALVELNRIRKRAGIPDFVATDKKGLEREIFDERGRELFFEGKRWYDIVRFHKGGTIDAYQLVPNLKGKTTPLYWPISVSLIARNPALKQTEGY